MNAVQWEISFRGCLHHRVEWRFGWRLNVHSRTSTLKSAPCLASKTSTAYGLCCQAHVPTSSEIKEWQSWHSRLSEALPRAWREESVCSRLHARFMASPWLYHSPGGAGPDFFLMHRATPRPTNPLDYSDGQRDGQGGCARRKPPMFPLWVPWPALPIWLKLLHLLPVTPGSHRPCHCVQIWGIWAIKHCN